MNRYTIQLVLGITAGLLLTAGVARLFIIRFQSGDIYPPYSTLRMDPLGTRALYESLARCPGTSVERSYMPPEKLSPGPDTAVLCLGDTMPGSSRQKFFSQESMGIINSQMRRGTRVVITLMPRNMKPPDKPDVKLEPDKKTESAKKAGSNRKTDRKHDHDKTTKEIKPDKPDKEDTMVSIHDWFGVDFGDTAFFGQATATLDKIAIPGLDLPSSISCHTSMCFTNLDASWKVIYRNRGKPVIIEREFGKGSIVLSALTYFVSNEAMRNDRHPALISWLIGAHRRIIFDEYHHGIAENPGVSSLIRKYNMHWLAAGLALLAGLFIWKNSISLVPPHDRQPGDTVSTAKGKDSTSGLINLLRRNIPRTLIINACIEEWKKASKQSGHEAEMKLLKIHELARRERDAGPGMNRPIETYNEICRILKEAGKRAADNGSPRQKSGDQAES